MDINKRKQHLLNEYKKSLKQNIMTSRFNNFTYNENKAYREKNPHIGCVYCTPFPITLDIPQDNILVEKPCGVDIKDAELIKNAFPGYIFLYSDEYQYIKNNLDKIGNPQYWKSIRASMGPKVRSDVSILEDYMIHDLYLYRDLFGECKVYNKCWYKEFESPIKESSLHLLLNNKIPGYFYSSWNYPIKERKIIIKGDRGSFIWENDDLYYDSTHYINNEVVEGICEKIETTPKSNLDLELDFFILGQKPNVNILDIWKLINVINK